MNGKLMVSGMIAVALAAGVGLWYSQTYAYYEQVDGVDSVLVFGDPFPVSNYRGIDANTSPLKLRACFTVGWDFTPTSTYKDEAEPLVAPSWFDCFDAETIAKDIETGTAVALLADKNEPFGFSRFIAQYPDGRAYMWRQLNACGRAEFDGDPLPEGCGPEDNTAETVTSVDETVTYKDLRFSLTPVGGGAPEEILHEHAHAMSDGMQGATIWGCFDTPMAMGLLTETYEVVDQINPENPPFEFPCFDAENIINAVADGDAVAFLSVRDIVPGMDRVVAVYQDGHAVAWHQEQAK